MKSKGELGKTYTIMAICGVAMVVVQTMAAVAGMVKGVWWPYVVGFPVIILLELALMGMYHGHAAYVCPECGEMFRTGFWRFLTSRYVSGTRSRSKVRKLQCPQCGHRGYCVEVAKKD